MEIKSKYLEPDGEGYKFTPEIQDLLDKATEYVGRVSIPNLNVPNLPKDGHMGKDLLNYLKGNLTGSSTKYEEVPEEYYKTPSIFAEPRQEVLSAEIDPSGKGMILYRGTNKAKTRGLGSYTPNREYAESYGKNIHKATLKDDAKVFEAAVPDEQFGYDVDVDLLRKHGIDFNSSDPVYSWFTPEVKAKLKKDGYDAITFPDEGVNKNNLEVFVLNKKSLQTLPKTSTPEFKSWFKDSKVVDDAGNPLVVYHGTTANIDTFSKAELGKVTGAKSAKEGFFFTDRPYIASDYAELSRPRELLEIESEIAKAESRVKSDPKWLFSLPKEKQKYYNDLYGKKDALVEKLRLTDDYNDRISGANVLPVNLSMQKPLIHDFKGERYRDKTYAELIEKAKSEGRDGVILKNTYDPAFPDREGDVVPYNVYIVFEPTQIKSIFNKGKFNPDDPNILSKLETDTMVG